MDLVGKSLRLLQENMHVGVPVILSSKGYLLFWDNPAVTQVDIGKTDRGTLAWQSEAGSGIDYYVALGPEPDRAIAGYRWLTGAAPLFPYWSWGFWQSRERYKTQAEILDIVHQYRERHIPLDGIIQDWQYWAPLNQETAENGWGSHIFDASRYPDPAGMVKELHDEHAHLMIVSWAKFDVTNKGVSIPNLKELEAVKGVYEPAIPYVYPPGRGKWYDPFNDEARRVYWSQLNRNLFSLGVDAWWLDASEAELSGNWGEYRDFKTAKGPGAVVYNAYPLEHTRTIYEGQRSATDRKRVFILTRASYAGQQRNAAVTWSGDIRSSWKVLQEQIPAGLNFVASGVPYWNTDICGFFGNDPDDPKFTELCTRWYQFGSFTPMFRVHGTNKPKEVWRFDAATQATLTDIIRLRYHLLPYIYSTSWRVTHEGYTLMRPLVMDFRTDKVARASADQFMFGPSLLINPVTTAGATSRQVYLPGKSPWIDFWSGESVSGGKTIEAAAPITRMPIYGGLCRGKTHGAHRTAHIPRRGRGLHSL
jgi:alpha-D-xyloside xylohydrolase